MNESFSVFIMKRFDWRFDSRSTGLIDPYPNYSTGTVHTRQRSFKKKKKKKKGKREFPAHFILDCFLNHQERE